MTVLESYEALEGRKDFATYEAGWKARIPEKIADEAKALLSQLDKNPDYVVSKAVFVRILRGVFG